MQTVIMVKKALEQLLGVVRQHVLTSAVKKVIFSRRTWYSNSGRDDGPGPSDLADNTTEDRRHVSLLPCNGTSP